MSQTKAEFVKAKIEETLDLIVKRERLSEQSLADMGWIRFYLKDMISKCEGCDEAPTGSQNENKE